MILNSAPQDQAIMSNVGEIGEFRIRNSAKAFSILSSGLYANKVRAIVRELSCNAVDSHTAAGKQDTPFDVHLPNQLEPWFSIRDYGTGLSGDQVTSIYTTYFESTKTESNEFIGALGLGSKSPFSYTDNFTVTAIKDGSKRIYTAFINEQGVPSIALMNENDTSDQNGVEVKFSVNDRYDFEKFRSEAQQVYTHFKLRPVVSGSHDFKFMGITYLEKDIIPGVHTVKDSRQSYAVMGNIAYPIAVPQTDNILNDNMKAMLKCGLVIEFGIGELDFQASREGLSYVPLTIESIKRKLEELTVQLSVHIATEANKIVNLWERAVYLAKRKDEALWLAAVSKYVTDTKFPLIDMNATYRYSQLKQFKLTVADLAAKYNLVIRGFTRSRGMQAASSLKANSEFDLRTTDLCVQYWTFGISLNTFFVFNDTSIGALERSKFHWKNRKMEVSETVYVLEAADKNKPMLKDAFLKEIMNPPSKQVVMASSLMKKERKSTLGKDVSILYLTERSRGSWGDIKTTVWADAGNVDTFSATETHYYLPLSGYQSLGKVSDVKTLYMYLKSSGIFTKTVYGVRKADMEFIKLQKNWINIDTHIEAKLSKLDTKNLMGMVKHAVDFKNIIKYNVSNLISKDSPYNKFNEIFSEITETDKNQQAGLEFLCRAYGVNVSSIDPVDLINKYKKEATEIKNRYPLLRELGSYTDRAAIAEYINLVDEKKGI